ncbi:hypothetical protein OIU76_027740, partial [Salix suchowensis]
MRRRHGWSRIPRKQQLCWWKPTAFRIFYLFMGTPTDRWTSRSNKREKDEKSPLGFQNHGLSETERDVEQARRVFSGQRIGIRRGRL